MFVSELADDAVLTVRVPAVDDVAAEHVASDLRIRISERLRTLGIAA